MTKEEFFNGSTLSHTWSWMKRFAEKGYFFDINNEPLKNNVKDMMDTLEAVYPNRWSFFFDEGYRFPRILIHFPCFEISNSEGRTHTIRDLYVMLHPFIFYSNTGKISFGDSISGFRTTLTDAELNTGYLHSHLRGTNRDYFNNFDSEVGSGRWFCLGSGETLDLLNIMDGAEEFDKNLFELFLYTLDSFVKWESLEGGPYKKLRNISVGEGNEEATYSVTNQLFQSAKDVVRNTDSILYKLKYTFSNGNVSVIPDMDFEDVIRKCFLDNNFMDGLCINDDRKYYCLPEKYTNSLNYFGDDGILFRGYKIKFKVLKTVYQKNLEIADTSTFIVHPSLYRMLRKYLNERVTFKYLNYYARKRKIDEAREAVHQYRSVSGDNQEDTIPVQ